MALDGHLERHILRSVDAGDVGLEGLLERGGRLHHLEIRQRYAKRDGG